MAEASEKAEISLDDVFDVVVRFLTGKFPYCPEAIAFGMALQGAMAVRKGPNKDGKLHWFHAFVLSALASFAGGTFNFIWMGQPSGILTNDVFMGVAIICFVLVNYTPGDVGFALFNTTPISIAIVSFAQLFRSLGTIKFLTACYEALKGNPSAYYPIPIFGPILYGILLGNMGPLVLKGLEAHIGNGVPWPVQNGLFVAPFYHFFVHDQDGCIGITLRKIMPIAKMFDLDDKTFALAYVSLFMQVTGILQMPQFLGPSFTPFGPAMLSPFFDPSTWTVGKYEGAYAEKQKEKAANKQKTRSLPVPGDGAEEASPGMSASKKRRKNKKKKTS
uniref:Uncharacterized protein n=1 Tax=Amphora coffeiformis TaxID=265554 RepID=A0A7S3L5W6_9STRA|mmetsp:Transcript_20393/g.38640  ORF Transcript_20393/g.38640 Transcript_20393/m.38640 type:complete len:332 (+) Transcript_20393:128-1123(+)|eukprot:scaffold1328_cov162-Amphora_coffeaeformis.AAC.8